MGTSLRINHEALRAIRERSGYSVSAFATEAGVDRSHYSNIEAGRRQASVETVTLIARTLKVPITAILCEIVAA